MNKWRLFRQPVYWDGGNVGGDAAANEWTEQRITELEEYVNMLGGSK